MDKPTADSPFCIEMPDGTDFEITECPNRFVGPQGRDALRMSAFAKKGLLPVSGGVLDQSASAMRAFELIWSEQASFKAQRGIPDDGSEC